MVNNDVSFQMWDYAVVESEDGNQLFGTIYHNLQSDHDAILSNGEQGAKIRFFSDHTVWKTGFKVKIEHVPKPTYCQHCVVTCAQTNRQNAAGFPIIPCPFSTGFGCKVIDYHSSGGYSNNEKREVECTAYPQTAKLRVYLTLADFTCYCLPVKNVPCGCEDAVRLNNVHAISDRFGQNWLTDNNKATVTFTSDTHSTNSGFRMRIEAVN